MAETTKSLKNILVQCKHIPEISAFEEWAMHAEEVVCYEISMCMPPGIICRFEKRALWS